MRTLRAWWFSGESGSIKDAHDLARLDRNSFGERSGRNVAALEELDRREILGKVGENQFEKRLPLAQRIGVAVVDPELLEVACNKVDRLVVDGDALSVAERLLNGSDHNTLALLGLGQVDAQGLLLDDDLGGRHVDIDETLVVAHRGRNGNLEA